MVKGILMVGSCLILTLAFTLSADDLHDMSMEIAQGIYESQWIGTSIKTQKSLIIMMRRAQKPLVINVEGLLPALTCKFYTTFLSLIVSYFMTLRELIHRYTN